MNAGLFRTECELSDAGARRPPTSGAGRTVHDIRRNILRKLARQMNQIPIPRMKCGFTFLERSQTGSVENAAFQTFDSFEMCCVAAEQAANADPAMLVESTHVVYCRYNDAQCLPEMQPVLKTYERKKAVFD